MLVNQVGSGDLNKKKYTINLEVTTVKKKKSTETIILSTALRYHDLGLSVIPIHTPTLQGCSCSKGELCEKPGKHPLLMSWKKYQKERVSCLYKALTELRPLLL